MIRQRRVWGKHRCGSRSCCCPQQVLLLVDGVQLPGAALLQAPRAFALHCRTLPKAALQQAQLLLLVRGFQLPSAALQQALAAPALRCLTATSATPLPFTCCRQGLATLPVHSARVRRHAAGVLLHHNRRQAQWQCTAARLRPGVVPLSPYTGALQQPRSNVFGVWGRRKNVMLSWERFWCGLVVCPSACPSVRPSVRLRARPAPHGMRYHGARCLNGTVCAA